MIDLKQAELKFKDYTSNFDLSNENIERKYYHSYRVEELCRQIAISLSMTEEEIDIAALIGLLHDIGRFEQFKQYATFNDALSFDHGNFGAELLKNSIREYINYDKYDNIILQAIKNHNKLRIDSSLSEDESVFAKIIRDADKLDILYEFTCIFWNDQEDIVNNSTLLDYSYDCIKNHKLVEYKDNLNYSDLDSIAKALAFVFDLNFATSFQIIKNNDYINKILDRFQFTNKTTQAQVDDIRSIINNYITSKL